jgi:hypothetical protein
MKLIIKDKQNENISLFQQFNKKEKDLLKEITEKGNTRIELERKMKR